MLRVEVADLTRSVSAGKCQLHVLGRTMRCNLRCSRPSSSCTNCCSSMAKLLQRVECKRQAGMIRCKMQEIRVFDSCVGRSSVLDTDVGSQLFLRARLGACGQEGSARRGLARFTRKIEPANTRRTSACYSSCEGPRAMMSTKTSCYWELQYT